MRQGEDDAKQAVPVGSDLYNRVAYDALGNIDQIDNARFLTVFDPWSVMNYCANENGPLFDVNAAILQRKQE